MYCCIILLVEFSSSQNTIKNEDFHCADPDNGGTVQNNDRRFLIIGSDDSTGAGMGNLLIFFPAAYYFAALTGRDIIISDKSHIGEMCRIIKCGFPFVSEMALAYPGILNEYNIKTAPSIKKGDMQKHFENKSNTKELVIRAWGYKPESDWWVYWNENVQCVHKFTSCDIGDVSCAERHAYQRLIKGPFHNDLSKSEEDRIHGVPDNVKHAILSLPHSFAPRIDCAIHLRTQFSSFEQQLDSNSIEANKEVDNWLNSTEGIKVFDSIENKLLEEISRDRLNRKNSTLHHGVTNAISNNKTSSDPIYVYLAADNEKVKEIFAKKLELKHSNHLEIKVMRVRTNGIFHVKNLSKMKKLSNGEGILDMVFDWYALSLANTVLAWRKGSTHMISTFVQSASRLSGTPMRTSYKKPLGLGGIGTLGEQLETNKRGNYFWNPFWIYGWLEDYRKPDDRRLRHKRTRRRRKLTPKSQYSK
jgi:hypothetical protein